MIFTGWLSETRDFRNGCVQGHNYYQSKRRIGTMPLLTGRICTLVSSVIRLRSFCKTSSLAMAERPRDACSSTVVMSGNLSNSAFVEGGGSL